MLSAVHTDKPRVGEEMSCVDRNGEKSVGELSVGRGRCPGGICLGGKCLALLQTVMSAITVTLADIPWSTNNKK